MSAFLSSIRFRLALTYSLVVFGLVFLTIAAMNYALSTTLDDMNISGIAQFTTLIRADGSSITIAELVETDMQRFEREVNEQALDTLRRFSMWALLGLFPLSIGAGWIIADRALRPIGKISKVAREIQATDLSRRIDLGGPDDELRELADTFDAMLDRVETGVDTQRAFIQDTSHELRNPLAVMATNLDVALADPNATTADLRDAAEIVRRTVDRATRTVDDLVVFARKDVPEVVRETVTLRGLADEVLDDYTGPLEESDLTVEFVGEDAIVNAERAGVKRAMSNLMNNAVRLTRDGSTLRIGSGIHEGFAWLGLEDQGPGIDPLDHISIFQRYWSGDKTSLREERRSGLGLAIAKQIAQSHGGELTVRSVIGAGAAFVLWFPLEPGVDISRITDDGVHPIFDPFATTPQVDLNLL